MAIDGVTFVEASHQAAPDQELTEYTRQGETIDHWTLLVGVRRFKKLHNPIAYIFNLSMTYHKKFPYMRFATSGNKKENRAETDFLEPADTYYEWNYFRSGLAADGSLIVYQYAKKIPMNADTLANIRATRSHMIPLLDGFSFQELNADAGSGSKEDH
jgi:hypothetical protein